MRLATRWVLLLAGLTLPSQAAIFTIDVVGIVTDVDSPPSSFPAQIGDPISYSALVDSSVADTSADTIFGEYLGAISSISFSFGGVSGTATIGNVGVYSSGSINVATFSAPSSLNANVELYFRDTDFPRISSDNLTAAMPALPTFGERYVELYYQPPTGFTIIRGRIDSIQVTQVVPEPNTLALAAAGLGLAALTRRRRQR